MAERLVAKKKVVNGVLYTSGHIKISKVRLSYPHLDKPHGDKEDNKKYSVIAMLPKKTHGQIADLVREQIEVCKKAHKGGPLRVAPANLFIKDGDVDYPERPEYEGHWIISARESKRPDVFDMDKEQLTTDNEIAEAFYGGCWGSVVIRPWSQDNSYGKRINANLSSVLKVRDDEPFGEARIDTSDAWGDDDEDDGDTWRNEYDEDI